MASKKEYVGWEPESWLPHVEDDLAIGVFGMMECWLCGEGLEGEAYFHIDDTEMRYPLCSECNRELDLCLLLMELAAQVAIDQLVE